MISDDSQETAKRERYRAATKGNVGKRRYTSIVKTATGAGYSKFSTKYKEPYHENAIRHLLCAMIEGAVQEMDRLRSDGVIVGLGKVVMPVAKEYGRKGFKATAGAQALELVEFFGETLERLLEIIDSPMLHADRIRTRVGMKDTGPEWTRPARVYRTAASR